MLQVPDVIVETNWLNDHLNDSSLIILDATIKKVTSLDATASNHQQIKNAIFFDLKNTFSDQKSRLPNTVLTPETFQKEAQKLGINQESCIVVYDALGIYSSPRVWWLFKLMGFENIAVLNGGFPAWLEDNYPTDSERRKVTFLGDFEGKYNESLFSDKEKVKQSLYKDQTQIIDARGNDRFKGVVPEPREGLRSGHIPSSINTPYTDVLNGGKLKPKEELKEVFKSLKTKKNNPIFSCGSGITACILALASESIGIKNYSVYDGSWTEWGSDVNLPIEL